MSSAVDSGVCPKSSRNFLAAVDHDVMSVGDAINADGPKGKRFEAHGATSGLASPKVVACMYGRLYLAAGSEAKWTADASPAIDCSAVAPAGGTHEFLCAGEVERGRHYLLLDDFTGQGGTAKYKLSRACVARASDVC
jgi:hypothetical protein